MRLDSYLVEHSFVETRNKAQEMIKKEFIFVNDKVITKSSFKIKDEDSIKIKEHKSYVSRAAFKLLYFLDELNLDLKGSVALDIGSSTGGFTQVLLENGVAEVSSVDVGRDQLHHTLKNDKRVFSYENCDIRTFNVNKNFDIVVSDVSFISLHKILDDVNRLATKNIILLFKPQFEVGREVKRDKKGVVLDKKSIDEAMVNFEKATNLLNWHLVLKTPSKLSGKDGNLEYCYFFKK